MYSNLTLSFMTFEQYSVVFSGHGWFIDDVVVEGYFDGVEENLAENHNVTPNPAKDFFRLEGFENGSEINIYNSLGQLILTKKYSENEMIDVSDFASGVYFAMNGNQSTKFIIE